MRLNLTGPQVSALMSALEMYLEEEQDDTDAQEVLDMLQEA